MPGYTAQEGYDEFKRTGAYANNPKHFASDEEWANYKEMIPKEVKKKFREGVAANENKAIEGMAQGRSREDMGIYDRPEEGRALYRRLGAGLGTGIDINKAYDWGGGTATEVGTSDLTKRNIEQRGITDVERERHAALQSAGSPEAFWQAYRGNQISGLLSSGAIQSDGQGGYLNPGPGGGDHYGANLEGYNLGQGPMGQGRGDPRNVGYTPQTSVGQIWGGGSSSPTGSLAGYGSGAPSTTAPTTPAAPTTPSFTAPKPPAPISGGGSNFNTPASGLNSLLTKPIGGLSAAGGANIPVMPPGPLPGGGTPLVVHPNENVQVTPAANNPAAGGRHSTFELPPGNAGIPAGGGREGTGASPFGPNPVPLPTGNGLVPGGGSTGGSTGATGGAGSATPPGALNLPGNIPMTASGLPPGMGGFQNFQNTSYAGGLANQGGLDIGQQQFNLDRAKGEYMGARPYEDFNSKLYGQVLGYDFGTGRALTGEDAQTANAQSFGLLAPQAQRSAGDANALVRRIESELPPGGERDAAIAEALRGAQSDIGSQRQGLFNTALSGVTDMMNSKKGFDPGSYSGGNQALLDAYGQGRGQDVGAYGNALNALTAQRGQDVGALTAGRGQDVQFGLGNASNQTSQMQNLWNNYLQGRGQDIDLYSTTRGQDLATQQAAAAAKAQKDAANKGFWGTIAGAAGSLLGGSKLLSDARAKDDITRQTNSMDLLKGLSAYNYTYNGKGVADLKGVPATGFLAQEVQKVLPAAVDEVALRDGTMLALQPTAILATAVSALREVDARLARLETIKRNLH